MKHDTSIILSMEETIYHLGVSRSQIYNLIAQGKLRRIRWEAAPRNVFFRTRDVKQLMTMDYRDPAPDSGIPTGPPSLRPPTDKLIIQ